MQMQEKIDPKNVNPYDSKAYKRVSKKKKRIPPQYVNPYSVNKDNKDYE
jgi:hypothetical protein